MDHGGAITALIHAYAERLDGGDLDGVAALFADATWRSPARVDPLRGAADVRRAYDGVILYDGVPCTKHVVTNVVVVVDEGARTATARSYFTVLQGRPGFPLQPIIAGRYHDTFARVRGRWRFADRLILPDLIGDLSHHLRTPVADPTGAGAPVTTPARGARASARSPQPAGSRVGRRASRTRR